MDTDRCVGALIGTFTGDALGMPWEGSPAEAIPSALEMAEARLGAGTYTDDTEMMIALAESVLRCDRLDPHDLARTFLALHDPRRGYGGGTIQVLASWRRGVSVEEGASLVFDGGSLGNGAAMRVAPVAVRFHRQPAGDLLRAARASARVTHADPVGIDGAAVQASAVAAALRGEDPYEAAASDAQTPELRDALARYHVGAGAGLGLGGLGDGREVPPIADASVAAAVVAGSRAESFEQTVSAAVRAGGDTDTTAAMAGAIAGARFGASSIPREWLEALEDGERGRRWVEKLALELAERATG